MDPSVVASPGRPFPAAWPHTISRWIERLPIPPLVAYAIIAAIAAILLQFRPWTLGMLPYGALDASSLFFGLLLAVMLWIFGYLERAGGAAFDAFRPALAPSAGSPEMLRRELATTPAGPALVATIVAFALTVITFIVDPESSNVAGVPAWVFTATFVLQVLTVSLLFVLLMQLGRLMLRIRRILAQDAVVDIFRPGPLHALSGLTARIGAALVIFTGSAVVVLLPTSSTVGSLDGLLLNLVPYVGGPIVIAVAAFVVPLYGTHGRLVDEKRRLEAEAEARLKGLILELNSDIDTRKLTEIGPLHMALASMVQEKEIVAKLSTWPWSNATARGFATAILFPLGLLVVQRILVQLV